VDWDTAESVDRNGRMLRWIPARIWVRANEEGLRPACAVLIILALLWRTTRPFSICPESGGDDHYGELGN
jgi:hypothetical protein